MKNIFAFLVILFCSDQCWTKTSPDLISKFKDKYNEVNDKIVENGGSLHDSRIIGGQMASPGQFPYQVSLQRKGSHFCGGSIINDQWILTAAHCTYGKHANDLKVVVGEFDLSKGNDNAQTMKACRIDVHPNYNEVTITNDIALIKTKEKIQFNDYIQPISLEKNPFNDFTGKKLRVSGWGNLNNNDNQPDDYPDKLYFVDVPYISDSDCKSYYVNFLIRNSMLCAGEPNSKDSCQGDSGGPLVTQDQSKQIGIVSWGNGCANGYPGVYTEVSYFNQWIQEVIDKNSHCSSCGLTISFICIIMTTLINIIFI